jgi:hypothetical protein
VSARLPARQRQTLRGRLLSRLIIDPSGCLLWAGALDRDGYGKISVDGSPRLVHRVMWEMSEGPIPPGLTIDHVKDRGCTHKNCASIAHLEPVTHQVNMLRGNTVAALHAAQTACDSGHEFDLLNTYFDSRGRRHCRECSRQGKRRRYAERKTR